MRQIKQYTVLLIFVLIIGYLAACGDSKTIVTKDGDSIKVSEKDDTTKIVTKDEDGKSNTSEYTDGKSLPDDFPKHIPIPDKALITGSIKNSADGVTSTIITFTTELKIDDLHKLYSEYVKDKKYSDVSDMAMGDTIVLSGRLDDYTFSLMAAKEEESASINTTISWVQNAAK